jgi:phage-related protein
MNDRTTNEAEVWWWGRTKEIVSGFPIEVKRNLGFALRQLQWGEEPADYRPLSSIGKGLFELRDQDEAGWYRIIYLSRMNDVIHVVHAFEKDTAKIPEQEKKVAQQNLKKVRAYLLEEKRHAKRKK